MTVRIDPASAAAIVAHLERAWPEEGCGVLLGRDETDGSRTVLRALPIDNERAEERQRRYLIAPGQFLDAEHAAREQGLDVLGFFHSHPDHPARPSAFDLEHAWPYYSYVIASVTRGRVDAITSWRLADDRSGFEPETLEMPVAGEARGRAHDARTQE
jgi:proteasome lid subunit RPN8/RPN11